MTGLAEAMLLLATSKAAKKSALVFMVDLLILIMEEKVPSAYKQLYVSRGAF
jgi:hypothetical protein